VRLWRSIAKKVREIDGLTAMVATAAYERSVLSGEVTKNVAEIGSLTEHTTDGVKETSVASQELMELSTNLNKIIQQFSV